MNKNTENTLNEITKKVYSKYKPLLEKEQYVAPLLREACIDKMNDESLPEYQRQRAKNAFLAGTFDEKEVEINHEVAEKYEKELTREINRAIKDGKLEKPDQKGMEEFMNKLKKEHGKSTK